MAAVRVQPVHTVIKSGSTAASTPSAVAPEPMTL
jgi:hypothetical protein